MVMMPERARFHGEIKVASRIIDYLSSGLYQTPAACLKELVNNSFDADAKRVNVFVKPDADRIIVEDDGLGMSREEFETHFQRVSESHKRDGTGLTPSGRPIIGRIGIGLIAANEICDVMEIFSTKPGSPDLLHVNMNFAKMREPAEARRRNAQDFAKGDYVGEVTSTDTQSHYTHVFLKGIRSQAKAILSGAKQRRSSKDRRSLYGLTPGTIATLLSDPELASWSEFDFYSETALIVALNVPVRYHEHWFPDDCRKDLLEFQRTVSQLDFAVYYDNSELRKPVVFHDGKRSHFVAKFIHSGPEVAARGYFYVQHGVIRPQDVNGVLIRIRNTAIGSYDSAFLSFPSSEGTLFQKWISAEIWADDRLEDAMNIDRRTFRTTHPAYVELQDAVHEHLSTVIRTARSRLYQAGSLERRRAKAKTLAEDLTALAENEIAPISKTAARAMAATAARIGEDPKLERRLLRRLSVIELYRLILEVAHDTLPREDLRKFLKRLTQRLSQ
jgi:hypothetical protein